jgi:hypothetical protein
MLEREAKRERQREREIKRERMRNQGIVYFRIPWRNA